MRGIYQDNEGVIRFRGNPIVQFLARDRLNDLSAMAWEPGDWDELYQLLGYSITGYCDVEGIPRDSKDQAWQIAQAIMDWRRTCSPGS